MNVLVNALAFKIAWLSTIFGAANAMPMLGPLVVLVAVTIHLRLAREPRREIALILMTAAVGLAWDSALVTAGWLAYPTGTIVTGLAPYWIVGMWILFATTLNVSFRWLQERPALAAAMGGVFGPLSYQAGAAAGAVELVQPVAALTALGIAWALLMPGLLMIARQLDGVRLAPLRATSVPRS